MGTINLSNPQVLKNFVKTRVREGAGKFYKKEKVLVFRDEAYGEFLVPEDIKEEIKIKIEREKKDKEEGKKKDKEEGKKKDKEEGKKKDKEEGKKKDKEEGKKKK